MSENKKDDSCGNGSENLLVDAVALGLTGIVSGCLKIWSVRQKKKWDKTTRNLKIGDVYTGFISDQLKLKISDFEDIKIGFAVADNSIAMHIDDAGAELLRESYGEEQRLNSAVKLADKSGLHFSQSSIASGKPSSKMIVLEEREKVIENVLSGILKDGHTLSLKVAYMDVENLIVRFYCEVVERAFIHQLRRLRAGVDAARAEHEMLAEGKNICGEIIRSKTNSAEFTVRLDQINLHDVTLSEPNWNDSQRYKYLTSGYFNDYVCENWLDKHEFTVLNCNGGSVNVESVTIAKALGLDERVKSRRRSPGIVLNIDQKTPVGACNQPRSISRIIVDASNVVRADAEFSWRSLRTLIAAFEKQNRDFALMFDANITYVLKASGDDDGVKYIESLQRTMPERLLIVPAGSQADDYILFEADKTGAHILSRDRYRDAKFTARYRWLDQDAGECRLHKFAIFNSCLSVPDLDIRESIN